MPKIITVGAAAQLYAINPNTIRKWLQRGKLTSHGHDDRGRALINEQELERLVVVDLATLVAAIERPEKLMNYLVPSFEVVPLIVPLPDSDDFIAADDAAEHIGVSPGTIRTWASRGYKNSDGQTEKLRAYGIDDRGRKVYRWADVYRADQATRHRAGRSRQYPPRALPALREAGLIP